MNDPKRWLDDESAPAGVRDALRGSRRAEAIDPGARARVGKHVARLSIVPVSLLTWLGAKTALAALGAAAGIATMSVATVVVFATREKPEPPAAPATKTTRPVRKMPAPPASVPPAPEVVVPPASSLPEAVKPPVPTASFGTDSSASARGLAEETEFLERARRTLRTDPEFALLLVREHGVRFPRGKLGAERSLIEIEALYRSGHRAEARALAEQKLASGAGGLYSERIRALLARIDEGR